MIDWDTERVVHYLHQLPGSSIFIRYVRSSYQNDPWRSLLELLLFLFALRVWLSKRTRGDGEKGFVGLSENVRSLFFSKNYK